MSDSPLARKYGYSEEASKSALGKMVDVLGMIARRLEAQEQRGSRYIVGDSISAIDLYWATMCMSLHVPGPEVMPLTQQNKGMLKYFGKNGLIPAVAEVLTDRVKEHQHYILTKYCETPAILGGDLL